MANIPNESAEGLSKEVYARFGLAYYLSECLHRGLCHVYVFCSFAGGHGITRSRIAEKASCAYSLTLGQVTDAIADLVPEDLYRELKQAVEKRNYLAHHLWFDKIHLMFTEGGLRQVAQELAEYANLFERLDLMVEELLTPKLKALGFTDDLIQKSLAETREGKPAPPLPSGRKPKKAERLVHVWQRHGDDGRIELVFETEDGCLWELCDVGLGWTAVDRIAAGWQESETFRPYLPATIDPRPDCQGHWHYEIQLGRRAVLWVRPAEGPVHFRCGIRRLQPQRARGD